MTEKNAGKPNWDQADFTKGDSSSDWIKGAINQLHDLRLEHMKETDPDRPRGIGSNTFEIPFYVERGDLTLSQKVIHVKPGAS